MIKLSCLEVARLNFDEQILNYKNIVNEKLNDIYLEGPINIKEPIDHILKGGKRFRPILCLLTCSSFNGDKDNGLIAALAIELLHNFTLVHDDIMDKDDLRHGNPTIHSKWNDSIAILSGDAILALALIHLNRLTKDKDLIIQKFNQALIKVCEGQALDLSFENSNKISEQKYIDMIDRKTGHILGLCSEIGSILSNNNNTQHAKLKRYGILIGRAFQIQDDLLEVVSNQKKMGKSLKSDFLLNKKTYLTIKANSIDRDIVKKCIDISKNDFNLGFSSYRKFLLDNGILDEAKDLVDNILKTAIDILDSLDMNDKYLYEYTNLILNRDA